MFSVICYCSISVTTTTARQWNLSTNSHSTSQRHHIRSESEEFVAESRATVTVKVLAGKKSRTGCSARFFSGRLRFSNLYFSVRLYFYGFRHSCSVLVEQASTCDVQPATPVWYSKNPLKLFVYFGFFFSTNFNVTLTFLFVWDTPQFTLKSFTRDDFCYTRSHFLSNVPTILSTNAIQPKNTSLFWHNDMIQCVHTLLCTLRHRISTSRYVRFLVR